MNKIVIKPVSVAFQSKGEVTVITLKFCQHQDEEKLREFFRKNKVFVLVAMEESEEES